MGQSKPIGHKPDCDTLAKVAQAIVALPLSDELQDVLLARACRKWLDGYGSGEPAGFAIDDYAFRGSGAEA